MQVTETQTDGLKRAYKIVISASEIDGKITLAGCRNSVAKSRCRAFGRARFRSRS